VKSKPNAKASIEHLRSAQTRLISRVDPDPNGGDLRCKVRPYISDVELGWDEVLDEGYDAHHSSLGCPVYWRVIKRGDEQLYCSTFLATHAQIIKGWGTQGLSHCNPVTGMAVARIETNLLCKWPPIENRELREQLRKTAALRRIANADPQIIDNPMTAIAALLNEERLLNLTSALKTFHGNKVKAALPIFRHWVRTNYNIAEMTPEWHQEVEDGYAKIYRAAKPLKRAKALDAIDIYSEHFFKTATADERAALATALGATPVEYEIRTEGFSMRELMQALKIMRHVPDDLLIACFERYAWKWHRRKFPITAMSQLIAMYRGEPAMKSVERAMAILRAFGLRLLDVNKPEDVQKWKEVSGVREH
jgi:hypothetical protein